MSMSNLAGVCVDREGEKSWCKKVIRMTECEVDTIC